MHVRCQVGRHFVPCRPGWGQFHTHFADLPSDQVWNEIRAYPYFAGRDHADASQAGIGQTPPTAAPDTDAGTAAGAADGAAAAPAAQSAGATQPPAITAVPYWPLGTPMSMLLYVSPEESVAKVDIRHPSVVWDGLEYGNWKDQREENIILDVPETVRSHNGSWWMDILLVKGGGNTPVDKAPGDVVGYRKGEPISAR